MKVVAVIPSRGRPERCMAAVESLWTNATLVDTSIVVAIDRDDPEFSNYLRDFPQGKIGPSVTGIALATEDTGNLVKATNTASLRIAQDDPDCIIGNIGDDQLCRTVGWDKMVRDAMTEPGFVYGNDLFQGEALPCGGIFIHAAIVNALGWYALPELEHLFIDNVWKDLGEGIGRLTYLPDMVIEHMHPLAGKADWDEGYERANGQPAVDRDRTVYEAWRDGKAKIEDELSIGHALYVLS
jgi:hypothetical protein